MSLATIVDSINNLLEKARTPFLPISALILACSIFKRPGTAPMLIASKIIKEQPYNTEMPDGTPNMMNRLIYSMTSNIISSIQTDGVVEVVIPAGSMVINGTCITPIGPGTVTATNTTPTKGYGILR